MNPRTQPFSQMIKQERRRWMPLRRGLSKENQEAFDRMLADATQSLQAEVQLGCPWRFDVMLMAVLSVHAKRLEQVRMCLEAINTEKLRPEGNAPM
jgi:hypothetical protein